MDPTQYAELFLAESREHLSTLNQLLLEWERRPEAKEPVGGIFRSVHTIKGMAATMGYATVAELSHRTENLLDLLRRGERAASSDVLDLLFRAADTLEAAIEGAVTGQAVDVAPVVREIDEAAAAFESEVERPEGARPSMPIMVPATGAGRLVRVVLRPESPLKGARATLILRRMEDLGTLHSVEPAPAALESDAFDGRFAFRIECEADDASLVQAIETSGDVDDVTIGGEEGAEAETGAQAAGPTRHIRVDLRRLDALMNLIGELVTARGRLAELSARRADPDLDDVAVKISQLTSELQSEIIEARMTPVWQVFDRYPRLIRDVSRQLGKQIAFRIEGKEIELDRAILDEIGDPLVHLLRNAVDHGIEAPEDRRRARKPAEGEIVLSALRERNTVAISVRDDGRGIDRESVLADAKAKGMVDADVERLTDEELFRLLARPGFSTAAAVSDVSGRGVGIDVVATRVRTLGGTVEIRTRSGEGTTFTLRLPTTLAIVRALLTRIGDERYALPLTHVSETVDFRAEAVTEIDGREAMSLRDRVVPLVHLRDLLGASGEAARAQPVIVLEIGERRSGLVVDQLLGQQEIVVKEFPPPRGTLPVFSGATILGDGRPVLILDAGGLV